MTLTASEWRAMMACHSDTLETRHPAASNPGARHECCVCLCTSATRADTVRDGGFACATCCAVACAPCFRRVLNDDARFATAWRWGTVPCFVCGVASPAMYKCLECGSPANATASDTVLIKRALEHTDAHIHNISSAGTTTTLHGAILNAAQLLDLQLYVRAQFEDTLKKRTSMHLRALRASCTLPFHAAKTAAVAALSAVHQFVEWTYVVGCLCAPCAAQTLLFAYCAGDCMFMLHRTALHELHAACPHCVAGVDSVRTRARRRLLL
jgi:hypothetical protein